MRNLALIFLFAICSCATAATNNIKLLRTLMNGSADNKKVAELFVEQTKSFSEKDGALLMGFKAMAEIMICKHTAGVFSKLSHFNSGKALLEKAIHLEPANTELIYFRYTTQTNAPALLGYYSNTKTDRLFLLNYLQANAGNTNKDVDLYTGIKNYLLKSPDTSASDKELIKQLKIK